MGRFFSRGTSARFLEPRWSLFAVSAIYRTLVRRSVSAHWLAQGLSDLGLAEPSTLEATIADPWSLRRADGKPVACSLVSRCPEVHWLDGLDAALAAYRMMSALCDERGSSSTPRAAQVPRSSKGG